MNWRKDSPLADLYERQFKCQHRLIRDAISEEDDSIICSVQGCQHRWSPGDTREYYICRCVALHEHQGGPNYTGLSYDDVLAMFEKQEALKTLAGLAVPVTVN